MAWDEAVYIIDKMKNLLVPKLTSLETNVKKAVTDTMNDVVNNVLLPKLPDNRDSLDYKTVEMRHVKRYYGIGENFNINTENYNVTSAYLAEVDEGPPGVELPPSEQYGYIYKFGAYARRISLWQNGGERIKGKGKILPYMYDNTYENYYGCKIDGTATIGNISGRFFSSSSGTWAYFSQQPNGEITFSKEIEVYMSYNGNTWTPNPQGYPSSEYRVVGYSQPFLMRRYSSQSSTEYTPVNLTAAQITQYKKEADDNALALAKKGMYVDASPIYYLYLT